ncbi:hypothetical protein F2P56_016515 [Juglans regia]|uniref:Small ribosomal subunit protein uS17c n=2 Tax=Juglans regia TaxID=51240 RepID=A0A2I4G0R7_JUGRE|nr:30S ribosomal protein S17, chloroplastic-like [Juglans regia]KAF5466602.1 hypothetical protein F2P56_016515 [Juglans regia]
MPLTATLIQLPPLHTLKLSSPFLHGCSPLSLLSKPTSSNTPPTSQSRTFLPSIKAMKSIQGKVVCATNDKTVAVEVVRLAPHPKYKRRIRKKKKYQAHDPDNQFKVGDVVQLEKSKPISKNKAFVAVPVRIKNLKTKVAEDEVPKELSIPLESKQKQQA